MFVSLSLFRRFSSKRAPQMLSAPAVSRSITDAPVSKGQRCCAVLIKISAHQKLIGPLASNNLHTNTHTHTHTHTQQQKNYNYSCRFFKMSFNPITTANHQISKANWNLYGIVAEKTRRVHLNSFMAKGIDDVTDTLPWPLRRAQREGWHLHTEHGGPWRLQGFWVPALVKSGNSPMGKGRRE